MFLEIDPLVPETALSYFLLDGLRYHGHDVTIAWDASGTALGRSIRRWPQGARRLRRRQSRGIGRAAGSTARRSAAGRALVLGLALIFWRICIESQDALDFV